MPGQQADPQCWDVAGRNDAWGAGHQARDADERQCRQEAAQSRTRRCRTFSACRFFLSGTQRLWSPGRHSAATALLTLGLGASSISAATVYSADAGAGTPVSTLDVVSPIYYPVQHNLSAAADEHIVPEDLLREFMLRHTAMDYPAAVEAAMRLVALVPDRPIGHYNLACALSRLRRLDEAADALERAIQCGWRDLAHLLLDPDLHALRSTQRYVQAIAMLRELIEAERIAPCPLRNKEAWRTIAEELSEHAPALMQRHHVPGLSIALVHDGEFVWTKSFGVGDRRSTCALNEHDRFAVHGPAHLVALLACQLQYPGDAAALADVLHYASELRTMQASAMPAASRPRVDRGTRPALGHPSSSGRSNGGDQKNAGVLISSRSDSVAKSSSSSTSLPSTLRDQIGIAAQNDAYSLIRLLIEQTSEQRYAVSCEQAVMTPLGLQHTSFAPLNDNGVQLVYGHSVLGSVMQLDFADAKVAQQAAIMFTTAEDLARLMQHAMRDAHADKDAAAFNFNSVLEFVDAIDSMTPGGLGLAIDVQHTTLGMRIEVADMVCGIGCLMRWYPQARSGVVVLYNSATGHPAAVQLAQLALGGE